MREKIGIGILLIFNFIAFGQEPPHGEEFLVNTYTEGIQRNPQLVSLQNGNFVVCWESFEQDGFGWGIYGQVFSLDEKKVGNEFRVNTYTKEDQQNPRMVALSNGNFVICWESHEQDGSGWGIYGQIFGGAGEKVGEEFQVNAFTQGDQRNFQMTSLSNGRFVVCWESMDQDGSGLGIYGQVFSENGEKIWTEFQVNTYAEMHQQNPQIASLSNGNFVICWESLQQDGFGWGVYAQLFSSEGKEIGNEFQVNTWTENGQRNPKVISLSEDRFVVCWESWVQDEVGSGIFAKIFLLNGLKVGDEFRVNTYTPSDQRNPQMISLPDGGFAICWESILQDGSGLGVYGQVFTRDGEKVGNETCLSTSTRGHQQAPMMIPLPKGGFLGCWESLGQDGSGWGIYGQFFSPNYEKIGREFRMNTQTQGNQRAFKMTPLSNGNVVIVWTMDGGAIRYDIYGKCFISPPIVHSLKPFSLLEPKNDSSLRTRYAILRWKQATDKTIFLPSELHYSVYIDDTPDFTSPEIYEQDMDTTFLLQNLQPGRTYFWKVLAKNIAGDSVWSSDVFGFYVRPDVGVEEISKKPDAFSLDQNYPNPFNASTEIRYELPVSGHVTVAIYDIKGRLVRVLVQGVEEAGSHSIVWDGKDESGKDVPSGIYVYVLRFEDKENLGMVLSRKMGLVR